MGFFRVYLFCFIPSSAAELVELPSSGEDDESDLRIAENRELVSFLQEAVPTLGEGHLPVDLVLDPLQLYPSSPHFQALDREKREKRKQKGKRKQRREFLVLEAWLGVFIEGETKARGNRTDCFSPLCSDLIFLPLGFTKKDTLICCFLILVPVLVFLFPFLLQKAENDRGDR